MTISWIPIRGQGYWFKAKLIGQGTYVNENTCIMEIGMFAEVNGELSGVNCTRIDYSDSSNVVIYVGDFTDGKQDGTITEYLFAKSDWNTFTNNGTILCTKYDNIYSDGVWSSTITTTPNVSLQGDFEKNNDLFCSCGFNEL